MKKKVGQERKKKKYPGVVGPGLFKSPAGLRKAAHGTERIGVSLVNHKILMKSCQDYKVSKILTESIPQKIISNTNETENPDEH